MNLIGEHTDYNGGLALPTVTPLQTTVACTTRDDDRLALHTSASVPWASLEIEMSGRAARSRRMIERYSIAV